MKNPSPPECVVLYRWKLKPGMEEQFIECWSHGTEYLLLQGSFGSRLHKGSDGLWYGYAQWPNAEAREIAFSNSPETPYRERMRAAIEESFEPIFLAPVADYLCLPQQSEAA
jgi:hypothetical protein